MPHVVIDGVTYVPAGEVVLDREGLIAALIEQYYGDVSSWTPAQLRHLYDDTYIVVTEDSDGEQRESLSEFIVRLSQKRPQ